MDRKITKKNYWNWSFQAMKIEGCKSTFSTFVFAWELKSLPIQPNQHLVFVIDFNDRIDQIQ